MVLTPDLRAATAHAIQGESTGLSHLVEGWLPIVVGWCTRLGGPRVDAEDAAHDVFIVVARKIHQVADVERFPAWLFAVTRRVLAQHRRRAFVRRWIPGASFESADHAPGPARLYAVNETGERVREVLETLGEEDREVLVLALLEDRPDTEVAEILEVPLGTMKSRLRRARERFLRVARARGLGDVGEEAQ